MFPPSRYEDIPYTDVLTWAFGNAIYDQDKPILIDALDDANSVSYRQAKSYVRRLIAGLHANGFQQGDSVCVHAFNSIYYPLVYLAAIGAGGCFVGSNPGYTKFELGHLFSITKARYIFVEPDLLDKTLPAIQENGVLPSNVFTFNSHGQKIPDGFGSWDELLKHGEKDWETFDDETKAKSTTAALLSTSGTTGLPKAAVISHHAMVAQSILIEHPTVKPYEVSRLLCLPFFHAFAGPIANINPIRLGLPTFVMKRFDMDQFVESIQRHSITETLVVPPMVINLLALPQSRIDRLSTLRYLWCAGAPLDGADQKSLNQRLHQDAVLAQVWGLTEIGWISTIFPPEKDCGNVGRLLPNTEAKILDKDGKEIMDEGIRGEILLRGPSMLSSYLNAPEATKSTIVDGWLHTGDIGYCAEGKWYIVDRAKELIKVRGWQVSPTELETCLRKHEYILDAAVIGVDVSDGQGEVPRAYIVLDAKAPSSFTDADIHDHMHRHLARYKSLTGGIKRVDSIPKSASGKILKKTFRERAEGEIFENRKSSAPLMNGVTPLADIITVHSSENKKRPGEHEHQFMHDIVTNGSTAKRRKQEPKKAFTNSITSKIMKQARAHGKNNFRDSPLRRSTRTSSKVG